MNTATDFAAAVFQSEGVVCRFPVKIGSFAIWA